MRDNKHLIWAFALVIIVSTICVTFLIIQSNPFTLRLEMNNNTLEAVKSINFTDINKIYQKNCYSERCYFDIENNLISGCFMYKVDCDEFELKYNEDLIKPSQSS